MATASSRTAASTSSDTSNDGDTRTDAEKAEGDRQANLDQGALTTLYTAKDGAGIERVVGNVESGWTPAPTEASDDEKKAAAEREKREEEASQARLDYTKPSTDSKEN